MAVACAVGGDERINAAHDPGTHSASTPTGDDQRSFWSFQPVIDPAAPPVRQADWPKSPLDRFVLAGLEAKGLAPARPLPASAWQ